MNDKLVFGDIYDRQHYNYMLETNGEDYYLRESDFYTTPDSRTEKPCGSYVDEVLKSYTSYVEDIDGGDNFSDYCKEFFKLLEEEGYWD